MPLYEYELCEGDCKVCGGRNLICLGVTGIFGP